MPPKKGSKAKTPVKQTAAAAAPPPTITTSRGKEIETTAAAARPKRTSVAVADTPAKKAPVKKTAQQAKSTAKATAPAAGKKRGRPAKTVATEEEDDEEEEEVVEPPKKRGRPAKTVAAEEEDDEEDEEDEEEEEVAEPPKKRGRPSTKAREAAVVPETKKRGRPSKAPVEAEEEDEEEVIEPPKKRGRPSTKEKAAAVIPEPKKRGRPAEAAVQEPEEDDEEEAVEPPKKRGRPAANKTADTEPVKKPGRPAKKQKDAPAVTEDEVPPPKPRHQPPKGGETTQVGAADEAAAEQLEEELVDAVASDPSKPTPSVKKGRGRPPKLAGPGKKAVTKGSAEDNVMEGVKKFEHEAAGDEDDEMGATGKQYWLMKAEQEDREVTLKDGTIYNSKFTIDDLRAKKGPEPWDGVRNPTACKNMKAMKLGDLAFFYASQGKQGRVPGITGIMEVVQEQSRDPGAFDENSAYYVEDEKKRGTLDNPRWIMVHVEFRKKLSKPVTLAELKKYTEKGSVLANMQEFTAARLSVSKVSEEEWSFIVDNLIDGYEEKDEDEITDIDIDANADGAADLPTIKTNGTTTADVVVDTTEKHTNAVANDTPIGDLPNSSTSKDIPESDSIIPTTETAAPSSRPASRAGSRTRKPVSRAGSLAPPPARAASRGRSRTPVGSAAAEGTKVVAEGMEVIEE